MRKNKKKAKGGEVTHLYEVQTTKKNIVMGGEVFKVYNVYF